VAAVVVPKMELLAPVAQVAGVPVRLIKQQQPQAAQTLAAAVVAAVMQQFHPLASALLAVLVWSLCECVPHEFYSVVRIAENRQHFAFGNP
jgi:hypothetical protein